MKLSSNALCLVMLMSIVDAFGQEPVSYKIIRVDGLDIFWMSKRLR